MKSLVLLIVPHHRAHRGGVEQEDGRAADQEDGAPGSFGRDIPRGDHHEDNREPEAYDKRVCNQHIASVHRLNALLEVCHASSPIVRLFIPTASRANPI